MSKVIFVTGSSTGFGKEIAKQALAKGHKVAATARDTSTLDNLVSEYPETCKAYTLDVTKQSDIESSVKAAIEDFGKIDVLINNAGYGLGGGIEEPSDEQIRAQYETNLFGVINMMRAVLPHFRAQKSGHVVNVSSVVGICSFGSIGYYSSTKFAMESLSEALSAEVEHLGIKVTLVEPGGFRTDFAGRSFARPENRIDDYITSERIDKIDEQHGAQMGDPVKGVKVIIDVIEMDDPPLRLPLGQDAVTMIDEKLAGVQKNIDEWREVAIDTAVDED